MSDLFQAEVPDGYIEDVVKVMVEANWHTYQVLTKRSERLRDMLSTKLRFASEENHIWWGVSVEDKRYGLPRVDHLRTTPAAVRFLSIEPLLEDLGEFSVSGIDWTIVGGESGHGARPMQQKWVDNILKACRKENVAFFFKQWGGVHKSIMGRQLHGRTYDEMPERSVADMPDKKLRTALAKPHETKASVWKPTTNIELPRPRRSGCHEPVLATA